MTRLPALLLVLLLLAGGTPARASLWPARLLAELAHVEARHPGELGVYVRDLDTGLSASHRANESWYLASMVKVPVAIAVLRGIERGAYGLHTPLTLRAADVVDGAGQTNHHAVGSSLSIAFLLEQMITRSDNTASDMLIGLVGIREVNAVAQSLGGDGLGPITSLADVRRQAYGQLAPRAIHLQGDDFLLLRRQRTDAERLVVLSRLVHTPTARFRLPTVADAYAAYYATGLNSGRLDAYGELFARLAEGQALGPTGTAHLIGLLYRSETGLHRIKAGLPASVRFAHKTGTQRARACDGGLITVPGGPQRIVVVACTRDDASLLRSEQALAAVGEAIRRSGLLAAEGTP